MPSRLAWPYAALGCSSWLLVNSLYGCLSDLVERTPEGWQLAYSIQCTMATSNAVALAVFWGRNKPVTATAQRTVLLRRAAALVGCGAVLAVLVASLWDVTFGASWSVALLSLSFLAGFQCAASNYVYYPLAAGEGDAGQSTAALATGEALSGVAATALAWSQSMGTPGTSLRFSVSIYFGLLVIVYGVSALGLARIARAPPPASDRNGELLLPVRDNGTRDSTSGRFGAYARPLLAQAGLAVLGFGMLPSLWPLIASRFPSQHTVLLALSTVSFVADPLGRYAAGSRDIRRWRCCCAAPAVAAVCGIGLVGVAFVGSGTLAAAPCSGAIAAATMGLFTGLFGFANTRAYIDTTARAVEGAVSPYHAAAWCATAVQSGSLVGTLLALSLAQWLGFVG